MAYLVVDSAFNRANYPNLIGKVYEVPPSYAQVKPVGVSPTERPAEQNIGTQLLKTLVEHTINDITYEQMNRIVRRLQRMSQSDRNAPQRVAEVLYEELGADKSLQYVEKAFANGMIKATEYYKLRAVLIFTKPREVTVPPAAGIASQQLLAGQKRLQQDLGKIRDLGLKSLAKPMEALNKDVERLRRAWGI